MNGYRSYFDRQAMPEALRGRLMELEPARKRGRRLRWAALAACCLLAAGVGFWRLTGPAVPPEPLPLPSAPPTESAPAADASLPEHAFVVEDFGDGALNLPAVQSVSCPDVTGAPTYFADMQPPQGHFTQSLTKEQVVELFGREREALPWMLFWGGCTIWGEAVYDGGGALWQAYVYGVCDAYSFTLTLRPEALPVRDALVEGWGETDVNGVAVRGLSQRFDRDGAEQWRYEVEFLRDGVGVCFAVEAPDAGQADWTTALFVTCTAAHTDTSLTLEHILSCPDVPEWSSRSASLEEARSDPQFGAYLPESLPSGFSYREGWRELGQGRNWLRAAWERGMAEISVTLTDPALQPDSWEPVDLSRPETYDMRLYTIPLSDSVPPEYRDSVDNPVFRASDLSPAVLESRAYTAADLGDIGGPRMRFCVLYSGENGAVLARYALKGVTVEEAWAMLEPLAAAQTQEAVYN